MLLSLIIQLISKIIRQIRILFHMNRVFIYYVHLLLFLTASTAICFTTAITIIFNVFNTFNTTSTITISKPFINFESLNFCIWYYLVVRKIFIYFHILFKMLFFIRRWWCRWFRFNILSLLFYFLAIFKIIILILRLLFLKFKFFLQKFLILFHIKTQ